MNGTKELARPRDGSNVAPKVVLGVVGNDVHAVANRILEIGLREEGFAVCNIGVNRMPEDFVAAALEFDAAAILVSSLNGEGEIWCRDFRTLCAASGMNDILLYAGGNLVIGDMPPEEVESLYKSFGFDATYHMSSDLESVYRRLWKDLDLGNA